MFPNRFVFGPERPPALASTTLLTIPDSQRRLMYAITGQIPELEDRLESRSTGWYYPEPPQTQEFVAVGAHITKMNLTAWARERHLHQYRLLEVQDLLHIAELPPEEHFRGLLQRPNACFSPRVMLYVARKLNASITILIPSAQMHPLASAQVTHSEWTFVCCSHSEELGHIVLFYEGKYYLHYNQAPETSVSEAPPVAGTLHRRPYLAIREDQLSPIQPRGLENSCQDLIPGALLWPIMDLYEKFHGPCDHLQL